MTIYREVGTGNVQWRYDRHEIIVDGIVHGVGLVGALIGITALIFYASLWSSNGQLISACIYGAGLILTLAISMTYNIWPVSQTKWILRRFDHSAIFLLIAGTYTPFLQRGWDDPLIFGLLIFIWFCALAGIALKFFLPGKGDRLALILYLGMGWSGVIAAGPLIPHLSVTTMTLIVIGGLIYTIGVIFHVWEKLRFQNAIWHGFVVTAAVVHYAAVFACISLPIA